jgi:hypothetical protein
MVDSDFEPRPPAPPVHQSEDLRQLMRWLDEISELVEKHLNSWTWKLGTLALIPVRTALGKKTPPVEAMQIFRIIRAFRNWKINYLSRKRG